MRKDKYIRVSTAMGVVLTGGCGECKIRRSEHCKGCRTQTILDLLDDVAKTDGVEIPQRHGRLIDADAEGRRMILPKAVYQHDDERIYKSKVRRAIYETDAGFAFDARAIGKTVFLTREEAESALRKETDNAR